MVWDKLYWPYFWVTTLGTAKNGAIALLSRYAATASDCTVGMGSTIWVILTTVKRGVNISETATLLVKFTIGT